MIGLTITADDFGLCPEIDAAVCLLHDHGVVRRTSLAVNGPGFAASIDALRMRPALDVAVHLNLTDGPSILPPDAVPSLVDRTGAFKGGRHALVASLVAVGRFRQAEIRAEWEAQIARAHDSGIRVTHLNSHGHVHLLPPVQDVVADLLVRFAIPGVRVVLAGDGVRGMVLRPFSTRFVRLLRRRRLPTQFDERILGLRRPGRLDEKAIDAAIAAASRGGTTELIVHPANGPNAYHTRWRYDGQGETNALLRRASALR
jgi:predicted glycoside hydrolase/deacetylase ChbG (UPF0249 family)